MQCTMAEPFNANDLIELLRGFEQRGIGYDRSLRSRLVTIGRTRFPGEP